MKNIYKNANKPEKPFEEWAKENKIDVSEKTVKPKRSGKLFMRWLVSAVCVIIISLAIILPIVLRDNGDEDDGDGGGDSITQPKFYTAQDIESVNIEIDEVYGVEDILLFDLDLIFEWNNISKDLASDDEALILSYYFYKMIITDDENFVFLVNYRIKLYDDYEFFNHIEYSDFNEKIEIHGVSIYYKINEIQNMTTTCHIYYLTFTYDKIEYFLTVQNDVTDTTIEDIQFLLAELIPPV